MGDLDNRKWYVETITPSLLQMIGVRDVLYSGHTPYQKVEILETEPFGRVLLLDGKTQSSEADEFIYHEALVHPALLAHPDPRRVFIAGGGEGATLREVLRHKSVERAVMVDLDAQVVDLCKKWLPEWHQGSFDDPRAELRHEDARLYLAQTRETFDALVLDLPDPLEGGPAYLLYTQEFYRTVTARLAEGGLLVVQSGPAHPSPPVASQSFTAITHTLATVFPVVRCYTAHVPAFAGVWGFTIASKGPDPLALTPEAIDRLVAARLSARPRFYDGLTHQGMFSLSKPLRDALAAETRVITEEKPLFVV